MNQRIIQDFSKKHKPKSPFPAKGKFYIEFGQSVRDVRLFNITRKNREKEKVILMEEKVFVGYGYGRFKNDRGEMQNYCNVFVLEDFNGLENNDYHYGGQKAVKYRCVNEKVFDGINIGDRVQCYFDGKGRISFMVSLEGKKD